MTEWQGLAIPQLEGFTGFASPEGNGSYGVCVQPEALGEQEARDSCNLHPKAPAGSVFNRLVKRAGLERDNFVIWNSVMSRPPRNYLEGSPWEGQAIAAFAPLRDKAFELYRPRVFVALGNIALKTLTPYGTGKTTISHSQGYVLDGPYDGTWVIGTFHPSALMQGLQGLSGVFMWALQRAVRIARDGFCRDLPPVISHPSLDEMLTFERNFNPDLWRLDFDIETPESGELPEEDLAEEEDEPENGEREISFTIIRASLCYDKRAISFPWALPYREIALRMLARAIRLGVWNEDFDCPRLKADGAHINGRMYDWMKFWKHLQPSLPTKLKCRALEFVAPFYGWTGEPWKHLNNGQPEFYSACDALALNMCGNGIERDLRAKGQWELYERHIIDVYSVAQTMGKNGLPYDRDKASAFQQELQVKWDERFAELQVRVPEALKPSKQKTGYKKVPKDVTGLVMRVFKMIGNDLTQDEAEFIGTVQPFDIYSVKRWCKLEPFLPTSWQQLLALIKHYGHKAGTHRKTKKETTEDDTLKKLVKKTHASKKPRDQEFAAILQMCRECRQLSKVQGTYVKGWKPGSDGRIHATPGFWGRMFRVSWRRPNISATIQDKQEEYIAQGFRKCVATSSSRMLLESDWKGIEAVLVGWFAGDHDYMRLARLGVHDYMGIHMAGRSVDLALPDVELKRLFKDFKREHPKLRDDAKHTVHGTNYGMGPRLMSDLYGMTEKEAKRLQGLYFDLFPKVRAWQRSVLDRASRECKLRNPFGYEMPFWEVYRWDSKYQRYALGEDAKSAIAFLPRDTAAAMLKEVLLRLRYLADEGIMLCSTHDSITCELAEHDLYRVAHILKTEMESKVPELDNLSIDVEVKYGYSWHEDAMKIWEPMKSSCLALESASTSAIDSALVSG